MRNPNLENSTELDYHLAPSSPEAETKNPDLTGPDFDGIKLDEMKELLMPLREIIMNLKDRIKAKEYGLVIGDDASGRVPTLIVDRFLRAIYKDNDNSTKTVFIAGSRKTEDLEAKQNLMLDFLKNKIPDQTKNPNHQRVLVVTELIHHGGSVIPITEVLQKLNAQYDVATIGILRMHRLEELQDQMGTEIIYGMAGKPSIDGDKAISGVEKSYDDLFATKKDLNAADHQTFLDARADVQTIAEKLVKYYETAA